MRSIQITLALLTIGVVTHGQGLSQSNGSVRGVVKSKYGAIEFANIYLTLANDSSVIASSAVTDSVGAYLMTDLKPASYVLNVSVIGFVNKQLALAIERSSPNVVLNIVLEEDALTLQQIEVDAMRSVIQKTEEGFIINAASNLTQIGGTAADLLKNMPGVLVNAEGELTIRGKTPLTLINGRVSGITGIDRSAQLERIPASSIDRIEIISNPSARYDADAEGGVINIVLKKSEGNGTNGAFAVGAGIGERYRVNASAILNHKTEKWNVGLAYDNWYTTRTRSVRGDRINLDLPDEYFLTQRRSDERLIFYQNAKANMDYTPNDKNALTFEAVWAFPGEDNNETLNNGFQTVERNFTKRNRRQSNEIRRSHAVDLAFNYSKRFKNPAKSLIASITNTFGNDRENTDIATQYLTEQYEDVGNPFLQRTHTYQQSNLNTIAVDYVAPIRNRGILETGYKSIFRLLKADYERANQVSGGFIVDPLNSSIFDYNEQIHAVYAQYTGWAGDKEAPTWKYTLGLRAEQVWNKGETSNELDRFKNKYFNFFPSANALHYLNSQDNIQLSYSRRINRPGLGQLNPFTDITDSLNQHGGNPRLIPELIHSFELGYSHVLNKFSFSLSTFYRLRNSAIFSYTIMDESGVAFTQPLNFGAATTYGLETIATFSPVASWNLNASFSLYETQFENEGTIGLTRQQTSWYAKLINNITLFRDTEIQLAGNYTSRLAIPQGEAVAVYFVDLGLLHKLMEGKARLGLTVTDVFNSQKSGSLTSNYNFHSSRIVKLDTRALMVTFGYTFGTSFREKLMENRFKNE
jgi:outer membrane receptor protein involved in Fe transport